MEDRNEQLRPNTDGSETAAVERQNEAQTEMQTAEKQERPSKRVRIKRWQLLRWREGREVADLRGTDFVAVGKRAFAGQARLEEVRFPASLSAIKTAAFAECARLRQVVIDRQNAVGLAADAFRDCARLRTVEGSEMLSVIGKNAFTGCKNLRSVTFGRDLRRIGDGAFAGCVNLERLSIPSCTEAIGTGAFSGCTELAELDLEEGLTVLGEGTFRGCAALAVPSFPESLRELPRDSFRDCSAFDVLSLPGSVRSVGANAFRGCVRLTEVKAELGLTAIGAFAFAGCRDLETVALPHSLKKLGFGAFGLGFTRRRVRVLADNEYMLKRLRRLLLRCGSLGRVTVELGGETLAERRRARHSRSLDDTPTHIS